MAHTDDSGDEVLDTLIPIMGVFDVRIGLVATTVTVVLVAAKSVMSMGKFVKGKRDVEEGKMVIIWWQRVHRRDGACMNTNNNETG